MISFHSACQFPLQVLLLLSLLLLEEFGTFLLDNAHLGLERLFIVVGQSYILLRIAACIEILFLLGVALGDVQLVE